MARIIFEGTNEEITNLLELVKHGDNALPKQVDEYVTVITGIIIFNDDNIHARECMVHEIKSIEKCGRWELNDLIDSLDCDYLVLDDYDGHIDTDNSIELNLNKKPLEFTITKANFIDWFFNSGADQEQAEERSNLGYEVVQSLLSGNAVTVTPDDIWDKCEPSVIPISKTEQASKWDDDFLEVGEIDGATITLID